ncbi:MAG: Zn-dependent alcohol dehydrogenase [Polyangiaceae bacterium]|nr:Zn-dependent alcohol dehydrogenase [Polyangiaceae bacterium]
MKAAILGATGSRLEIQDLSLDGPGPGEVRIRMRAAGVCHSDLSCIEGRMPAPTPSVLGHEGAGVVVEVGTGVTRVKPGDSVIIAWGPPCGSCAYCGFHQPNLCEKGMAKTRMPHFRLGETPVMATIGTATFCEETVVPEISAIKIPKDVPFDVAALIGCGVTTGVGAAMNGAKVTPGSNVVVIGAGGVGISVIQGAKICGAAEIVAVDPVESKREWAKQFGATHAITPDELPELQAKLTRRLGFDYAFEVVGSAATVRGAWDATRRGGTTTILGVAAMDQMVQFSAMEIFYSEKTLRGSVYGSADVRTEFGRLIRLYQAGRLDLEAMITKRFELDQINDAFDALKAGTVIRSVIEFPA